MASFNSFSACAKEEAHEWTWSTVCDSASMYKLHMHQCITLPVYITHNSLVVTYVCLSVCLSVCHSVCLPAYDADCTTVQ